MVPAVILDNHAVAPYFASEFGAGNRPREHDIGWDMLEMWYAFQFVRERSMCLSNQPDLIYLPYLPPHCIHLSQNSKKSKNT